MSDFDVNTVFPIDVWKFQPSESIAGLTWREAYYQALHERDKAYDAGINAGMKASNKRVWYQKGFNAGLERATEIVERASYDAIPMKPLADKIRKEIKDD